MKHLFKFSLVQTHNFRNTNHFQVINDESASGVQIVSGLYKSFTDSFDPKTIYDGSSFPTALNQAYEDFRTKYKSNQHKEFNKSNKHIISCFVQLYLTSEGKLSILNHGGAQIGYLRSGRVDVLSSENLHCKHGDILYVNIEANPSFDPYSLLMAFEHKDSSSLENYHFPLFYVRVEEESLAHILPTSPPVKNPNIPHDEDKDSKDGIDSFSGKEPKLYAPLWKSLLVVGSLAVVSVGGWWGFNNRHFIPSSSTVTMDSVPMNTEDNSEIIAEAPPSTPTSSDFPKTDSLLTIYYQSNPRTLEILEQVAQAFNKEQANNPEAAQSKWEDLKEERKTLLLALLEPLDVMLNSAENAYRDRRKDEYQNLIEEADGFFKEAINVKWQEVPVVKERIERLNRIKSYNNEPDINVYPTN